MMRVLIAAVLWAAPQLASAGMSAEDFEAYVTGQTLTFAEEGQVYGIEEYLPNRRVRWAFLDGECQEGVWYPEGDAICFVYEDRPNEPQCWVFREDGGRLGATFRGDGRELYEAARTDEPLVCLGPEVGV
jgi:hypothetical protein